MARRNRNLRLTDQAYRGWDRLCTRRNVTFTALIEAMGEALDQGLDVVPERFVNRAHEIDSMRRSRRA